MSSVEPTLSEDRAVWSEVLEKLQHATAREFQIRGMNYRASNSGQGLYLGALYHCALSNNTIQHSAVELN